MSKFFDFYLRTKYTFLGMNIVVAVVFPVTILMACGYSLREMAMEIGIGCFLVIMSTAILGGYKKLRDGYEAYKRSK